MDGTDFARVQATLDSDTESWEYAQPYQEPGNNEPGKVTLTVRPNAPIFNCRIIAYHYAARSIKIDPRNPPDEVVLERAPILRGTVVYETGTALVYASVEVTCFEDKGAGLGSRTMTDEHGRFEAELQITPGRNAFGVIRARYPDYVPKAVQFAEGALRSELTVVMKRAEGGVGGTVIDSAGRPVRSYSLRVFLQPPGEFVTPRRRPSLEQQVLARARVASASIHAPLPEHHKGSIPQPKPARSLLEKQWRNCEALAGRFCLEVTHDLGTCSDGFRSPQGSDHEAVLRRMSNYLNSNELRP